MSASLEAQYDAIVEMLVSYFTFTNRILRRIHLRVWFLGHRTGENVLLDRWARKQVLGSIRTDASTRDLITRFANDEERANPFYEVLLSEYPLEALAVKIQAAHPDVDFARIERLYKLRIKWPWWTDLKVLVGGIFGFGAFVLNTVPKSFVKRLGINPEIFDDVVFGATLIIVYFSILCLALYWFFVGRYRVASKHAVQEAMSYLAIRSVSPVAQQLVAADARDRGRS